MEKKNKNRVYPSETAGSLITAEVPLVGPKQTIKEVEQLLFEKMKELEIINYLYVVNGDKKLIGVVSIKEIFRQPAEKKVEDIMKKNIISVSPFTDQEEMAILALKKNLKAIPVVTKNNHFLGVVSSDTILRVLHKEHIEDILRLGGIRKVKKNLTAASVITLVKARIPWLLLGLLGGILAAQIIGFFENTLKTQLLLALFIPVIVYMSDAVATQTETLIIRGIAIDPKLGLRKYLLREIKIGGFIALILAGLLSLVSVLWWQEISLGIILGLSMFLGIFLAVIVGMLIPLILQKLKKDPALGSGPLATILTDLLSITIYFLIANLLLKIF